MFDIGWTEIALIGGVAIVLLGPEDMPRALHNVGKIVRKIRKFTGDIQKSLDQIVNEVEVDELTREINTKIAGPDLKYEIERQLAEEENRAPEPPDQPQVKRNA
jgi:sec-independent protein translocase protein TatB